MTFSCADFTDSILNVLGIKVPQSAWDDPEAQSVLAVAEIERLQAVDKKLKVSSPIQYTIVWRKTSERRTRSSGPFNTENALAFIFNNQPCVVEAIRTEERKSENG